MAGIPGAPPDLRAVPSGCAFHVRCPLAIDVCHKVLPSLRSTKGEDSEQLVACHLYDPAYNKESPTAEDLARSYEALAEEGDAR